MIYENYEISLWTHNDNFVAVLGANGAYYQCEAYDPIYNYKTDGEETLSFTMPISYIVREPEVLEKFILNLPDGETFLSQPGTYGPAINCFLSNGQFITVSPHIIVNDQGYAVIDNSKWYSILTSNTLLANEKKVKLFFDKGTPEARVKEFVITKLTPIRDGDNIYCEVECSGLAFYELGKIGYGLTFSRESIEDEEDELGIIIDSTLNYWLDKVFPHTGNEWHTDWRYSIQMDYREIYEGAESDKVYEEPGIVSWDYVDENKPFKAVYRTELAEKNRYPEIEKSNKYNICQDLAELYGVYAKIEYEHGTGTSAGTITKRTVVFYNKPYTESEYSITYGDNETGIKKISDSKDIVTKLYVEDVESEFSSNGLITIADSQANRSKDNFILNFDYYRNAGMLTETQIDTIDGDRDRNILPFEDLLRQKNLALDTLFRRRYTLENDIANIELKLRNSEDKAEAAMASANDYEDKLFLLNSVNTTLSELNVLFLLSGEVGKQSTKLRRNGVIDDSHFVVHKKDGITKVLLTKNTHYTLIKNNYGNVIQVDIKAAAGVPADGYVYLSYNYNLFSYYTNEKTSFIDVYNTNNSLIAEYENILDHPTNGLREQLLQLRTNINNVLADKRFLINQFDATMGYFLREGSWSTDNHVGPYEQIHIPNITKDSLVDKIYFDSKSRSGEAIATYYNGNTNMYKAYVEITNSSGFQTIPYEGMEDLELLEKRGAEVVKVHKCGSNFVPQYFYFSQTGEIRLVLMLSKLISLTPGNTLWANLTDVTAQYKPPTPVAGAAHPHQIRARRLLLTDPKLLSYSLEVLVGMIPLKEFEDYSVFLNENAETEVTLNVNNVIHAGVELLSVKYKSDRTVEQLYFDAREVSMRSAYPDARYEVDFIYLQKSLNPKHLYTAQEKYSNISTNLNNQIELGLASVVRINDYDLEMRGVKGVVSEITINLEEPQNSSFIIQNYKTKFEDIFSRIIASTEKMNARSMAYERAASAITPDGSIASNIMQNAMNNNNIAITRGPNSEISWDDHGFLVQNSTPYQNGVYGHVLIKGGGIFLSDRMQDNGYNRAYVAAITPRGVNAEVLTSGRLDTEKINIYSGNQIRFAWNAEGLFAYAQTIFETKDDHKYIKFNEEGLFLVALQDEYHLPDITNELVNKVEVSWKGLILRNNAKAEVFFADPLTGNLTIAGTIHAAAGNIGHWLLEDGYLVNDSHTNPHLTIGLSAPTEENAIALWAGTLYEHRALAPFSVSIDGKLIANNAILRGNVTALTGTIGRDIGDVNDDKAWKIAPYRIYAGIGAGRVELNSDPGYPFAFFAGAENPYGLAPSGAKFSVTKTGTMIATTGEIRGNMTVSGAIGSRYFASGPLGTGWQIDGAGDATFNNVRVRGTITASVFEYEKISAVGGSLYVAPVLIAMNKTNVTKVNNKYVFTVTHGFYQGANNNEHFSAGRNWQLNDVLSIQGFIVRDIKESGIKIGEICYEMTDVKGIITSLASDRKSFTVTTESTVDNIVIPHSDKDADPLNAPYTYEAGDILERSASFIYMGTMSGTKILRKGILLTTTDKNAPYIDVYDSLPNDNGMPKVRIGKLTGITDTDYFGPDPLSGYGLYSTDAYLTGTINANRGTIGSVNNKWVIGSEDITARAFIYNGKSAFANIGSGVYLGTDGIALGNHFSVTKDGLLMASAGSIGPSALNKWSIGGNAERAWIYHGRNTLNSNIAGIYIGVDGISMGLLDNTALKYTLANGILEIKAHTMEVTAKSTIKLGTNGQLSSNSILMNDAGIFMTTTGELQIAASTKVDIKGGTGTSAIFIQNTGPYFLSAGNSVIGEGAFRVTMGGKLYATSAVLTGSLAAGETFSVSDVGYMKASDGEIAGFRFNGTSMYTNGKAAYNTNVANGVHIGNGGIGLGNKFTVDNAGNLIANNATLSGTITADAGSINRWTIGGDSTRAWIYTGKTTKDAIGNGVYLGTDGLNFGDTIKYSAGTLGIIANNVNVVTYGGFTIAGPSVYSVRAGTTTAYAMGIENGMNASGVDNGGYFLWAGHTNPASAPFSVKMNGEIKNIGNSYVQTVSENASNNKGVVLDVFFGDIVNSVDVCRLSIKFSAFRAYSTGAKTIDQQSSSTINEVEYTSSGGDKNTGGLTEAKYTLGIYGTYNLGWTATAAAGTTAVTGEGGAVSTSEVSPGATSGMLNAVDTGKPSANNTASATPGATGDSGTGSTGETAPLTGGPSKTSTGSTTPGSTGGSSVSISGVTGYKTAEADTSHNHAVGTLAGGSHSHTSASHSHTLNDHTHLVNSHSHSGPSHSHTSAAHSHGPGEHVHNLTTHVHSFAGKHSHTGGKHTHPIGPHIHHFGHSHQMGDHSHTTTTHKHKVTIPSHGHTIEGHSHDIVYGIYEGTTPTSANVYIDGTFAFTATGSTASTINVDIRGYFSGTPTKITRNVFHTVDIRPNTALGRISAHLYIKTTEISQVIAGR